MYLRIFAICSREGAFSHIMVIRQEDMVDHGEDVNLRESEDMENDDDVESEEPCIREVRYKNEHGGSEIKYYLDSHTLAISADISILEL